MNNRIEVYTRPGCGYCTHVKRLLNTQGLSFVEYDVYQQPNRLNEMRSRTSGRTYPQVFINDVSVGGLEEFMKLQANNQLYRMLNKAKS